MVLGRVVIESPLLFDLPKVLKDKTQLISGTVC